MKRKPESVFRGRKLTPEEIARDQEIRRKVEQEFPPAGGSRPANPSLCESIKAAIRSSKRSVQEIANEAGVSEAVVARFMADDRGLRVVIAEKLASVLGLAAPTRTT